MNMYKYFRTIAIVEIIIGCVLFISSFFTSSNPQMFAGIGFGLCYGGIFTWLIGLCFYLAIEFSNRKDSAYKITK